MGHHFVPQAYLRGFEDADHPNMIWVHPRSGAPRLAAIDKVAQSPKFYHPTDESNLNVLVERPANPIMQTFRAGHGISQSEKSIVAAYLATFIYRGARKRARAKELRPQVLEHVMREIRQQVLEAATREGLDLAETTAVLDRYAAVAEKVDAEPSDKEQLVVRSPWPSEEVLSAIYTMSWRLLRASPPEYFVTSDNPAYFFESRGLGNSDSELVLPLSPQYCLHCSNQQTGTVLALLGAERELVREMNRRMAYGAGSMLLAHVKSPQLLKLLSRKPRLSRINW